MNNIPEIVNKEAMKHGNNVRFVGEYKGEQVFSVRTLNKRGEVCPEGMPILLFYDGTNVRVRIGMENFDVFDAIRSSL